MRNGFVLFFGALTLLTTGIQASTSQVWEMTTFSDFIKGKFEGVSLGRDGRLSLAPRLDTLFASEQPVIWSVATASNGAVFAATGHRGRVFRIEKDGKSSLVWTADRPEVFAIASTATGLLYAASSPDGKIYRIENGKATEYFDPKTKYIWALAIGLDGALYAGTGDGGRVFQITAAGKGEEYYATGQGNVTSLMIDPQGRLLAGTEPNGILYRITAKDKAFVLYDANLPEIRAMAPQPDGSIIAVGLGGALAKKVTAAQAAAAANTQGSPTFSTSITVTADSGGDLKPNPPDPKSPQQQAQAAAQATASAQQQTTVTSGVVDLSQIEKSAIYRINPDNSVETLWSSKEENVYDILPAVDGQIYFATDASGRIYRLSQDRKLTLMAQTNEAEATRLLSDANGLLAATGNMGKIFRLGALSAKGTYESPVFDAGGVAQWGKLKWQGENGAGSIGLRTRSGNSIRPDKTWSEWSEPLRDSTGNQISSPGARYMQFSAEMSGTGVAIDTVSASYLPQNQPPVVRSITVLTQPASTAQQSRQQQAASTASAASTPYSITVSDSGDATPITSTGTPTQTLSRASAQQLMLSWQAEDPDQDKLVYKVEFRGDGERDWKTLRGAHHENTLLLDGDSLADGKYFFRITASDRESNAPKAAREADLTSSPVLIDNTPPVVEVVSSQKSGPGYDIAFSAQDNASALKRAEWSIDAGTWTPIAPLDGILDSIMESFQLHIDRVSAGEHVLVIRVADTGNNTGLAKVILR